MSSYRDDTNETAVAGSSTWMRLRTIAEGSAMVADVVLFGLLLVHSVTAAASDEVIDKRKNVTAEWAVVSDAVIDAARARVLVLEGARAADAVVAVVRVLHEDQATASDTVESAVGGAILETVRATDEVIGRRRSTVLTVESVRVSDASLQAASVRVVEGAAVADATTGRVRARVLVEDAVRASDEATGGHQSGGPALVEVARIGDAAFDHLRARDIVSDGALGDDEVLTAGVDNGQAWTANTDSWAMSRYAPYTFTSVAVIDGVAYASGPDGVYALAGGAQQIAASIRTGKLDVGKGVLVNLVEANMEYELQGAATMDVTQTQSGAAAETYSYELPPEPAEHLTNGRFEFGRGLCGRHFAFALHLTGTRGLVNDLSVVVAPSKRRV